jgi:antitoxin (DNA-binding transcriptional repressor) of toxin-antitoxin stability system
MGYNAGNDYGISKMSPKTFDIAYLSDNLTDLLSDIQNHVEVTLTRQGVPWAKVVPLAEAEKSIVGLNTVKNPRVAGFWQGKVKIAEDFDDESAEINIFGL